MTLKIGDSTPFKSMRFDTDVMITLWGGGEIFCFFFPNSSSKYCRHKSDRCEFFTSRRQKAMEAHVLATYFVGVEAGYFVSLHREAVKAKRFASSYEYNWCLLYRGLGNETIHLLSP